MKKLLGFLLALMMLLSLAACGGKHEEPAPSETEQPAAEEEAAAEPEQTEAAPEETYTLPDGELWVKVPENYVEYHDQNGAISGAVSQMFENSDYQDMASQAQVGLYYYTADGSNINFTISDVPAGMSDEAMANAYNSLQEQEFTKVYADLGATVTSQSFEHTEIDGAPAIRMVYDIDLKGTAYRVYQVQAMTSRGTYTWTMSDMTGDHEAEFQTVMDSAYIAAEKLYEQHLAERETAAAQEQETSAPASLKVTIPDGFKKSKDQNGMEVYAHKDGSMVLVKTTDFGVASKQLMNMGIENMSADDLAAQMEGEISDFEHLKIGDASAVTFSVKDKKAGQMYYLMAACEKNNTYVMVDANGKHQEEFKTMVSGAGVETAEP